MTKLRVFLALVLASIFATVALAQSGGGYDLSWSTTVGGGGKSSGNGYTVQGAIGQPNVAGQPLRGAKWGLRGGTYGPPPASSPTPTATRTPTPTPRPARPKTYLPLVLR